MRRSQSTLLKGNDDIVAAYLKRVAVLMAHLPASVDRGWLEALLPSLTFDDRLRWALLFDFQLEGLDKVRQTDVWEGWLKSYWKGRNHGVVGSAPLALSGQEAALMCRWALAFEQDFPEALALLKEGTSPVFDEHPFAWRDVRFSQPLAKRWPVQFVEYLLFVVRHSGRRIDPGSIVESTKDLPRLPGMRISLLGLAQHLHQIGWIQAREFKESIESSYDVGGSADAP